MKGFDTLRESLITVACALLYYVCFVPAGCILRLLRQDPMQTRPDPARPSYWKAAEPHGLKHPMKHPF
jgi:hypothetical protein